MILGHAQKVIDHRGTVFSSDTGTWEALSDAHIDLQATWDTESIEAFKKALSVEVRLDNLNSIFGPATVTAFNNLGSKVTQAVTSIKAKAQGNYEHPMHSCAQGLQRAIRGQFLQFALISAPRAELPAQWFVREWLHFGLGTVALEYCMSFSAAGTSAKVSGAWTALQQKRDTRHFKDWHTFWKGKDHEPLSKIKVAEVGSNPKQKVSSWLTGVEMKNRVLMTLKHGEGVCQHFASMFVAIAGKMDDKLQPLVVLAPMHAFVRVTLKGDQPKCTFLDPFDFELDSDGNPEKALGPPKHFAQFANLREQDEGADQPRYNANDEDLAGDGECAPKSAGTQGKEGYMHPYNHIFEE